MKYFTSDTHFGHANIIRYCQRPFASVAEMDAVMIQNIQSTLTEDDELYFLGDWSMSYHQYTLIRRLKFCHLYFILGNHDHANKLTKQLALDGLTERVSISKNLTIDLNGRPIHLVHRPLEAADSMATLCGHVHEKWLKQSPGAVITEYKYHGKVAPRTINHPILNVGVDQHGFSPISTLRVLELLGD